VAIVLAVAAAAALWWHPNWEPAATAATAAVAARRAPLAALGGIALVCLLVFLLWKLPQWQRARWETRLTPKDALDLEDQTRTTLAQIGGGLAVLAGLYFTWQQLDTTQRALEGTQRLGETGQITERFTRAIDQLGNDKPEIRVGSIYALERIATDSARDRRTIVDTLTTYVHLQASGPPRSLAPDVCPQATAKAWRTSEAEGVYAEPFTEAAAQQRGRDRADIRAIVMVLSRSNEWVPKQNEYLDLSSVNLRGFNLSGIHLEGAFLRDADLQRALLVGAALDQATLMCAHLEHAQLERAHLKGADLQGADLAHAQLAGAILDCARLQRAKLDDALGLTQPQIDRALTDDTTRLPAGLQRPQQQPAC
jgi:hypothetical protein